MVSLPKKVKFQKKYLTFITVMPLLLITSFIQVECPVCGGTGIMSNSLGMEGVVIKDMQTTELGTLYHACELFLMYGYEVNITLDNIGVQGKSHQDAIGWIKMTLMDFENGKPLSNQYVIVEVPAGKTHNYIFKFWFTSNHDQKKVTEVRAEVLTGNVPDETCGGTGKVPLNQYPVIINLKNKFQDYYVAEVPWAPPAYWEWYDDEDEGTSAFSNFYDPFMQ